MSHISDSSKVFFYVPEIETNKELIFFNPNNYDNNYKSMIDEGIQTEPKIIEQDESPEKDYSFLKEQNKIDNQFLNKKRK